MSNTSTSRWIETLKHTITKDDFTNMRKFQPDVEQIKFFIDLWLTEGVPYGLEKPYIYQEIRVKIANKLSLHPKDINLIGSARIGFSYIKEYKDFDPNTSDLDLFLVSQNYFEKIKAEAKEYTETLPENKKDVERQINKGFINSWYIPNDKSKYPTNSRINFVVTNINKYLHKSQSDYKIYPNEEWAGIRVYKSWDNAIEQNAITLLQWLENKKII